MAARYQKVKQFIIEGIAARRWQPGDLLPSENELVKQCGVSRMTARKAVEELASEGAVRRVQGRGTFVNEVHHRSSLIEIRNIALEIKQRNNVHHCQILEKNRIEATEEMAGVFQCNPGDALFHSCLLHRENGIPIQLEDRFVCPTEVPEYLDQDFTGITPHEYLTEIAPISEAEHLIEAIPADPRLLELLEMKQGDPCLLLKRTTWSQGNVVSYAKLYHPGSRYQLGSRFIPS